MKIITDWKSKRAYVRVPCCAQSDEKGESPIVCLVGPPGTGKTSIARSVARALDKSMFESV